MFQCETVTTVVGMNKVDTPNAMRYGTLPKVAEKFEDPQGGQSVTNDARNSYS